MSARKVVMPTPPAADFEVETFTWDDDENPVLRRVNKGDKSMGNARKSAKSAPATTAVSAGSAGGAARSSIRFLIVTIAVAACYWLHALDANAVAIGVALVFAAGWFVGRR